ncbi:MAG: crossover junction endodeoxyribonuclease RuvC [Candidatus Eisenbacteria bacterium]|uniref:Crossover junction endodeoxyribonuclease RuvC n=1 Tax=Eiseniibacteriota bacterium TaxID=2212470 RepID=A0A956M0Z6_UNCEI|nr:crossover junction endodeoxyribonuclease RuvC [Candidatus Eisenbacteria bacterium]
MRILGLDPGSRLLGYGVLERERSGWRRLSSGVLRLKPNDPIPHRLAEAFTAVREIIQLHRPEHVAIEECFVAHSPRSALVLGQVRGVLLLAARLEETELHEFAPRSVKLAAVGNGGASKEQVQAMIPRLLGDCRSGLGADEADALAVAWCCANQLRSPIVRPAGTLRGAAR